MIHYGKEPSGNFKVEVPAEEVGEVYDAICRSGLLSRRTFDDMRRYIEKEFTEELEAHRRRMAAQIPGKEDRVC